MTKIINLYGGPGTGKSTTAAGLFSAMKRLGINCELVTEVAKDLVWEDSLETLNDQLYVSACQCHRIKRLLGKVDYVITDSPILLGIYYDSSKSPELEAVLVKTHNSLDTIDIFIKRTKPYKEAGRLQSEAEAIGIDADISKLLLKHMDSGCYGVPDSSTIVDDLLKYIGVDNNAKE